MENHTQLYIFFAWGTLAEGGETIRKIVHLCNVGENWKKDLRKMPKKNLNTKSFAPCGLNPRGLSRVQSPPWG